MEFLRATLKHCVDGYKCGAVIGVLATTPMKLSAAIKK
jgi:hypothetical protein